MIFLHSDVYGELPLTNCSPAIEGDIISATESLYYNGQAGEIKVLQRVSENFTFYQANFRLNDKTIISLRHPGFPLQSITAMNQDMNTHIPGAGNLLLRQDHFLITHNPSNEMSFVFEKGTNYFAFGSSFRLDLIDTYLQAYFEPEELFKFSTGIFFALSGSPILASHKIYDVMIDIIQNALPLPLAGSYTALKMQELFILQLAKVFNRSEPKIKLSETQLETLEQIRQLMLNDFTKHTSLENLAKKNHINLHTLKSGFKQVYGLPPYEYQKQAKLDKAKELLIQTNKPIKQIAALVGYAGLSSFVTAFTAHFGYSPGLVRK